MDQVKLALAVLKKWHFWILCLLIVVLYAGTWFLSTAKMTKETETRVAAIGSAYSTGQRISGIPNHPNPASANMMKRLNREEAEQVQKAWNRRFSEQEDVLVWPSELLPDFIAAVEPLKPIESKVEFPTPPGQELKMEFRNRYRDYIRKELPKLAEIIGADGAGQQASGSGGSMGPSGAMGLSGMSGGPPPGMSPSGGMGPSGMGPGGGMGPSGMGPGGRMPPGMSSGGRGGLLMGSGVGTGSELLTAEGKPIVVEWGATNQAALQAMSMNWTSPTTLQVLYAQEDLWVLRSLMLVIKATNGDADAQYNAAVKELVSIELGAMAPGIKMAGRVMAGGAMGGMSGSGSMGGMMGPGMMGPGMMGPGMMGPSSGMSPGGPSSGSGGAAAPSSASGGAPPAGYGTMGMGGTAEAADPAKGRYVDDKNEPLDGDRLRTAIKSDQPADAFLAVAKRMPMRMRVRMNVLKLPLLLCEFSQSDLPVEVRQVRINTPAATGGGSMGGSGGYGGGGPPMLSGGGSAGGSMMGPPSMMGGGGSGGMMGGGGMMSGMASGMASGMGRGMMSGMGGGMGGLSSGGGQAGALNTESPYDASVEVYGIIYIYNPVDPTKLGIEEVAADATDAESDTVEGTAADATEANNGTDTTSSADTDGTPVAETGAAETGAAETGAAAPAVPAAAVPPAVDGTGPPATDGTSAAAAAEPAAPASERTVPAVPSTESEKSGGS